MSNGKTRKRIGQAGAWEWGCSALLHTSLPKQDYWYDVSSRTGMLREYIKGID